MCLSTLSSWLSDFFAVVPAVTPEKGGLFSFSEFLATLALLLVVITVSDYKYRYRLSLSRLPLKFIAFWVGLGTGISILAIDFWFHNELPIWAGLNDPINIKLFVGLIFVGFVFYLNYVAFVRPPKFSKFNADRYAQTLYGVIAEGNPDRMLVAAEELSSSIEPILNAANTLDSSNHDSGNPSNVGYAHELLLLIAEKRFCGVIANKVPLVASDIFRRLKSKPVAAAALSRFSSNVVSAFLQNKNSTIYQESDDFDSGLIGELKPLSTTIFGDWKTVEECTSSLSGPLKLRLESFHQMDGDMAKAFFHCAKMFCADYFKDTHGAVNSHAMRELFHDLETFSIKLHQLNGRESSYDQAEFHKLNAFVDFIRCFVNLLEKHNVQARGKKVPKIRSNCHYDRISVLIKRLSVDSSAVRESEWNAWSIQHNSIWGPIFSYDESKALAVVRRKVSRLIYDDIKQQPHPSFLGARLIGYVLSVLGWQFDTPEHRTSAEFYPLKKIVITWVVNNYYELRQIAPSVADACLLGKVTYDEDANQFVKTYESWFGGESSKHFLPVIVPEHDPSEIIE